MKGFVYILILWMWIWGQGMLTIIFRDRGQKITPYISFVIYAWPVMMPSDMIYCYFKGIKRGRETQ